MEEERISKEPERLHYLQVGVGKTQHTIHVNGTLRLTSQTGSDE
jgi:hypothetical protein